jgi:hypothetical protein
VNEWHAAAPQTRRDLAQRSATFLAPQSKPHVAAAACVQCAASKVATRVQCAVACLDVRRPTSHVTRHTSYVHTFTRTHVTPHTSHLTPHTSHLTLHTSHPHSHLTLTLLTSHLTPHTSHLTPHSSLLTPHSSLLTPHTLHCHLTPHTSHPTTHCSALDSHLSFIPPPRLYPLCSQPCPSFYSVILMAQPRSFLVRNVEAARRSVAFGVAFASALRCAILLPVPSRTLQVVLVWSLLRRLLPSPCHSNSYAAGM